MADQFSLIALSAIIVSLALIFLAAFIDDLGTCPAGQLWFFNLASCEMTHE